MFTIERFGRKDSVWWGVEVEQDRLFGISRGEATAQWRTTPRRLSFLWTLFWS